MNELRCTRVLARHLHTSGGTLHMTLISRGKDNRLHYAPFDGETHSTSFMNRCAIIRREHLDKVFSQSTDLYSVRQELLGDIDSDLDYVTLIGNDGDRTTCISLA